MNQPTIAEELVAAADPFKRVLAMNHPWLNNSDEKPLREFIPGIWPTWGEFKRLMTAISVVDEGKRQPTEPETSALSYSDNHTG